MLVRDAFKCSDATVLYILVNLDKNAAWKGARRPSTPFPSPPLPHGHGPAVLQHLGVCFWQPDVSAWVLLISFFLF